MAVHPVREQERNAVIDTLRGFALFGIVLINLTSFASTTMPGYGSNNPLDWAIMAGMILLVESKFFTLFSFLFGLGFAVQLQRAEQRGTDLGWRYPRRLFVLALFGIAHIVFLWEGDILLWYALIGILLLAFRGFTNRGLLTWVVLLLALPLVPYTLGFAALSALRYLPATAAELQKADEQLLTELGQAKEKAEELATKPYLVQIGERLKTYAMVSIFMATRVPTVLAMFLLGLYVGRRGILAQPDEHLPLLRSVRAWGLGLGLFFSALVTAGFLLLPPISSLVVVIFNQALAGPILALGYGATLTLLIRDPAWLRRFAPVAAAGRMPLTNYLTQSLVCALLFQGIGLGLAGKVNSVTQLAISVGIFSAQMVLSLLWLRWFQYGPLEWLWRSLTYLSLQPMQRAPADR